MPDDLSTHKTWTRDEWTSKSYMVKVFDHLRKAEIKSAVDVGGCTGEFTNILLEKVPTLEYVLILEPIEDNYQFILDNVRDDRVEVWNNALYQSAPELNLGRIDHNVGGWSVNYEDGQIVQCVKLEHVLDHANPDFVKIDIEGAERDVIENSEAIHSIPLLELEFHDQYLEPEAWRAYAEDYLPNHRVILAGDDDCPQNAFFVRN